MPLDFPSNPTSGQIYDNYYWDSSSQIWRASGIITPKIPAGVISQYAGATAPAGYLLCIGQTLPAADYQDLFNAIGYTYGGSGPSFVIPNLQNRVPVGKGSDTEFDTLGETGGAKTVTLTSDQMPSHTHTQDTHSHSFSGTTTTNGNHRHNIGRDTSNGWAVSRWNSTTIGAGGFQGGTGSDRAVSVYDDSVIIQENGNHSHTYSGNTSSSSATINATGGGQAHNNLQPYIVLNYIIKT